MSIAALLNGALLGGLYALVALGLTLVFGIMKVVNLAHGVFVLAGAYLAIPDHPGRAARSAADLPGRGTGGVRHRRPDPEVAAAAPARALPGGTARRHLRPAPHRARAVHLRLRHQPPVPVRPVGPHRRDRRRADGPDGQRRRLRAGHRRRHRRPAHPHAHPARHGAAGSGRRPGDRQHARHQHQPDARSDLRRRRGHRGPGRDRLRHRLLGEPQRAGCRCWSSASPSWSSAGSARCPARSWAASWSASSLRRSADWPPRSTRRSR